LRRVGLPVIFLDPLNRWAKKQKSYGKFTDKAMTDYL
jgi:hypothetical protein